MPVRVTCPACRTTYSLAESYVGKHVRCRQCHQVFGVGPLTPTPEPLDVIPVAEPVPASKKAAPRWSPAEESEPIPVLEEAEPIDDSSPGDSDDLPADALQTEPVLRRKTRPLLPPDKKPGSRKPRSRGKAKSSGSMLPLILFGSGVGVALVLGIVLAVLFAGGSSGPGPGPNGPNAPVAQVQKPRDPDRKVIEVINPVEKEGPAPLPEPVDPGLKPPALAQDRVVKQLPAPIADVAVGGNGRYLVLHLAQQRKLAVFDVNTAAVAHYIPIGGDNALFAAGLDKVVVVLPDNNVIQRFDLPSGRRELSAPLAMPGQVKGIALGSASHGPLWTNSGLLDVQTMKPLNVAAGGNQPGFVQGLFNPGELVRVSADGKVLGKWDPHVSPQGICSLVYTGTEVKAYREHDSAGHIVPGPDGRVLYTARGLFTSEVKALGAGRQGGLYTVPAVHGNYYLTLGNPGDPIGRNPGARPSVSVHIAGDSRPLVTLNDLDLPNGINQWDREAFGFDKRILFIPAAHVIATIPDTNDRLVLHRFDVEQALEKSGIDYLLVTSQPPAQARKSGQYVYRVVVKSKKGGVKYRLDSGPPGMKLSPSGLLRWRVPAQTPDGESDVIISVSDLSGQEIFHSFKVAVSANVPNVRPVDPVVKNPPDPVEPLPKDPPPDPRPIKDPVAGPVTPVEIRPAVFTGEKTTRPLPAAVADAVVGGGGRYLVLHLAAQRKLAVFDVSEAKVARYLPVGGDNVKYAAGMDKLIVVLPDTKIIQRWDLATGERELSTPLPVNGVVKAVAMGSASAGPMLMHWAVGTGALDRASVDFVDVRTLKTLPIKAADGRQFGGHCYRDVMHFRPSPDGTVYGVWCTSHTPGGIGSLVLHGNTIKSHYEHDSVGHIVPAADGKVLYTGGGLFSNEVKPLGGNARGRRGPFALPSVHGNFYLSVAAGDPLGRPRPPRDQKGPVTVHLAGDSRPLLTLTDLELPKDEPWIGHDFTPDKRLLFLPAARVIVTIPETNDRLVLHRFDLDPALEKSGIDYLLVTSQAPAAAAKGRTFAYQVVVKAKKGGVKYKLDSGPAGMTVSPTGLLKWSVPANPAEQEVDVIVSVTDSAGQELFHTFRLTMSDKKDPDRVPAKFPKLEAEPKP